MAQADDPLISLELRGPHAEAGALSYIDTGVHMCLGCRID
jgi:hypothetical protein